MTRSWRTLVSGAAVVAVLVGCSTEPEPDPTPAPTSTATASPSSGQDPTTSEDSSATTQEPLEELTGGEQNPTDGPPVWDEAAAADAQQRALAFMRAFARPDLPAEEWFEGIAGLMTEGGAQLFAYVDPINVPASEVTGEAQVLENVSPSLAEVHVDTDAGVYLVTLSRVSAGDPWLVDYADPVQEP